MEELEKEKEKLILLLNTTGHRIREIDVEITKLKQQPNDTQTKTVLP